MAKYFESEEIIDEINNIKAQLNGTITIHGTAITNLQTDVVQLDDRLVSQAAVHGTAITNLQTDFVTLDDRVIVLEGAP